MTQQARVEIAFTAMGIEQRTVRRLGNGVDGEVAACKILFERDFGPEFNREAAVAGGHLALEPRQRVLLVSIGVQKHREVASDFAIIQAQQLLARAPDHHPIALLDGLPKQGVPNGSANQIHLHA